ncbi:MAG: hypothetical protein VX874_00310 [Pseudomonadota bacterium]|nr:hypothetical protein [Pseudomonadota bacterium]
MAQNARRHEATAQPDPERVANWARIILDTPDFGSNEFLAGDVRTRSTLKLAVAEAWLAEATRALDDFEADVAPPPGAEETIEEQITEFRAMLAEMPDRAALAHGAFADKMVAEGEDHADGAGRPVPSPIGALFSRGACSAQEGISGLVGLCWGKAASAVVGEQYSQNPETKPNFHLRLHSEAWK